MIQVDYRYDSVNDRWNAIMRGSTATETSEQAMKDTLVEAWNRDQGVALTEADFEFHRATDG